MFPWSEAAQFVNTTCKSLGGTDPFKSLLMCNLQFKSRAVSALREFNKNKISQFWYFEFQFETLWSGVEKLFPW